MAPTEPGAQQTKAQQATEAGKEFSDLFFEFFDKNRHAIKNLYLDSASLIWNGQEVSGKDNIMKFLEELPTSTSTVSSLDCQPVDVSANENQTTIVVQVFGKVVFKDSKAKAFYQTFLLSSKDNVWKIVSDNYRFLETPPSSAGL